MATPLVVDITERCHPKFKKHPFKSIEVDPLGAFSLVLYGVLHVKDIRAYIHENLEGLGSSRLLNLYSKKLLGNDFRIKQEYRVLEENNFVQVVKFLFFDENEWV